MKTLIKKKTTISKKDNLILLCDKKSDLLAFKLSKKELDYVAKEQKNNEEIININQYERQVFIVNPKKDTDPHKHAENCRLLGDKLTEKLNCVTSVLIIDIKKSQPEAMYIAEGMALSNYTFTKHKNAPKPNKLSTIYLCANSNKKRFTRITKYN